MSQSAALRRLLDVLRQRDIPLGRDDVGWAFESAKTKDDIVKFVDEHLNHSTLLSKDELQLYQTLGSPTEDDLGAVDPAVRPIRDEELRAAINALKHSTAAIERHTKSLEAQKRVLSELRAHREGQDASTSFLEPEEDTNQQRLRERGQLTFAIEDLQGSIHEQLQELQTQSSRATEVFISTTSDRLSRHDQVLEALERLAPKLQARQEREKYEAKTIDQWCHALAVMREKSVKARIDAVMLQEFLNYPLSTSSNESSTNLDETRDELQTELKSLHDEISSVAKMVVSSDFREQIVRSLQNSTHAAMQKQAEWLEYVLLTQEHMIAHLQFFYEQSLQLEGHSSAVDEIANCFKDVTGGDLVDKAVPGRDAMSPTTPKSDSTSRLRSPTERSSTTVVEQALRRFNIGVYARQGPQSFAEANSQTRSKLLSQYSSSVEADLKFLSQASSLRDRELQSVLNKLYASSNYGSVRLTDKTLDGNLQDLDEQIADTAKDYAKVDSAKKHDQASTVLNKLQNWRN